MTVDPAAGLLDDPAVAAAADFPDFEVFRKRRLGFGATPIDHTATFAIVADTQGVLANAAGGNVAADLPSAASVPGMAVWLLLAAGSGANSFTTTRDGTDTIEGATTVVLSSDYDKALLWSDGISTWYRLV